MADVKELPSGTRVTNSFRKKGTIVRYKTKSRNRWAVVQWDHFTAPSIEYPDSIEAVPETEMTPRSGTAGNS
jgi:hypothetical protein